MSVLVGDIPAKERYLWIEADSVAVVMFKHNIADAAKILGWPEWRVAQWRRKNILNKRKPAEYRGRFHSKRKAIEEYVGQRLLDKYHKYKRTNSISKPFIDFL